MSAKHTPGPWQQAEYSPTDIVVGDVILSSARYSLNGIGKGEAIANARLIASAPDLLVALEDAEFLLRKTGQLVGPMRDSFTRSAADARAAIAKAKGE